jgi:ubiquinone/menaquinone biosynthesis C-methylase UbiE
MTEVPPRQAVRRSYDAVAEEYAAHFDDELDHKPLDRAMLAAFVEQTETGAAIADVGCGPGHVAAWIHAHGAPAVGIDLSPGMVSVGRRLHPEVSFREGDFRALPAQDGEFAAVVALYSIIHLEPEELSAAFGEIRRVLRPNGLLLVAFHAGTGIVHRDEWWGAAVDIDFRFLEPATVVGAIEGSGFVLQATLERSAYPGEVATRRAYLLARRDDADAASS